MKEDKNTKSEDEKGHLEKNRKGKRRAMEEAEEEEEEETRGRRMKEKECSRVEEEGGRNEEVPGSRREKRRHDDQAINNIGEKGDRLQHSAQMLNRYQFNVVQSAN
ncbi:hypothetical protein ANTPLA_LOCUS2483 [Anthophora plagiata]